MKLIYACCAIAALILAANAECTHKTVNVENNDMFTRALEEAGPGTDIKLAPGSYHGPNYPFMFQLKGEEDCPITISSDTNSSDLGSNFLFAHSSHVVFSNLIFVRVNLQLSKNIVFEDVHFKKEDITFQDALALTDCSQVTIRRCVFEGMTFGAVSFSSAEDCVVERCQFINCDYASVWFLHSDRNKVSNCSFQGTGSLLTSATWVKTDEYSSGNEFSSNSFVDTVHSKTMKYGADISGKDNIFKHNSMTIDKDVIGFFFADTKQTICASNKVEGGTFTNGVVDQSC